MIKGHCAHEILKYKKYCIEEETRINKLLALA